MSPNRYVWLFVLTALGGIGCSGDDLTEDSNESHDALTTGHIQVSRSADRSASVALDGKTESGVIYVFAEGLSTSVSRVDFRLDGALVGSEQHAPYDLKGTSATGNANPWDTGAVANGSHTLKTTYVLSSGATRQASATFAISNSTGTGGSGGAGGSGGTGGDTCGNGVVDPGEECDGAANCRPDCLLAISGTIYFVSSNGSDSNDGTSLQTPLRTISACASRMVSGDECYIRGYPYTDYNYRETVTPAASGVAFKQFRLEYALITGLDQISGAWAGYGNFYRIAHAGAVTDVFVNGQRMVKARYPNRTSTDMLDYSDWAHVSVDRVTNGSGGYNGTVQFSNVNWASNQWVGGTFVGEGGESWCSANIGHIISSNSNTITADSIPLRWGELASGPNVTRGAGVGYITDSLAALDAPNEWHWENGYLYLWAPGGVNPGTVTVEARTRQLGFDLRNRSGITIRGLNLKAASISMGGTSSSTIDAVTIRYPTVFVRVPQQNDWAPTPFDAGNSAGIFMSGTGNTVKNSYIYGSWFNGILAGGSGHLIENNTIEQTDWMGMRSATIMPYGDSLHVRHNTLHHTGGDGLDGGNAGVNFPPAQYMTNGVLENNYIYEAGFLRHDGGLIYINAQGGTNSNSTFRYNVLRNFHQVPSSISGVASYWNYGYYIDNETGGITGHHNIVTMDWEARALVLFNGGNTNVLFFNNTIWGSSLYDSVALYGQVSSASNVRIQNNVSSGTIRKGQYYTASSGVTIDHNIENASASNFVSASGDNFQLVSGAPEINAGIVISGVTDNAINAPDLGAFEYGATAWTAGSTITRPIFPDE
jgi:hypothetical protein